MGFLTRLIAGLTAAAALGAGLTGTANAVDVTGAAGTTKSVVKLTADDTNNLPDHIVNGSFDYPSVPSWTGLAGSSSNKNNKGKRFATINPGTGKYGSGCAMSTTGRAIPNWNRSSFAWNSTQGDAHYPGMSCEAGNVELNYDSVHHNQFAELTADQQGTAIYQDVKVTPGTMMKWSLKHSSATSAYVDKMQVMIGEPYKETAQEATRIASENGNKVGEKMTTISTPTTSDRADNKKWDTYSGTYLVPDGVTTVRFTFKSVASAEWYSGNDLDDIEFSRSYKLTYDKNSSDAAGQVPSNQRGKENTVQPAKTKTNGTVKTVADTNASLPDHLVNGDFSVNYHDQWKDSFGGWTSIDPNAGKTLHATSLPNGSSWKWTAINGWDKSKFGWTSTQKAGSNVQQKANAVELQYDDSTADNVYAELCAYEAGTAIYQDIRTVPGTLYKVRLKHASLNSTYLDKMQVMIGTPGHEQPVEMTRTSVNGHGDKLNEKSTTIATKVTNGNNRHHADQWETYEGTYLIPDGQTTTRFTFKSIDAKQLDYGNVLDDIVFDKAYRLSYDKNASDATGKVPSNQRGKENTTQPAKAKTNGTVKTVADESVRYGSLFNGDFSYPSFSDIQKNEQENAADLRTFLKSDDGTLWYNMSNTDLSKYGKIGQIPGFDSSRFAWSSTENGSRVELQQDRNTKNTYAEIVAQQDNTSIYQNVSTGNGGVLYKIRLKHASRQSSHADRMQVLVGSDTDHATPVEMTRVTSNGHGDKVGGKSTIITTKVSNTDPRDHGAQWETYEGYYQVPEGQKNAVFMFKSLEGFKEYETLAGNNIGNLVDDIEFSRSYKLTYDKNSDDATGSVPSDTTANTVKQAKAKTAGSVRTVADDDASKSLTVNPGFDVPDYSKLDDGGLHWMYVDPSEGNAWSYYDYINPSAPKHQVAGLSQATFGWQELTGSFYATTSFELHREKDGNVCADVHGSRTIGQTIDTQAGVAYTVSIRHSGRSKGNAGSVQVLVGPDKDHLQPLEMSRMNVSRTGAKYGDKTGKVGTVITTHSDSVDSTEGDHPAWDHSDDWETYSGTYVATGGKTVFAYRGVDENGDSVSGNDPVADSVIDDLSFKLAYRLSYDKNAADAAGSIPSDETANTVKQAKTRTTGTVRAVADRTASGLTVHDLETDDVPGDYRQFVLNTTDTRLSQVEFEDGAWYRSTDSSSQGMWPLKAGASLTIPSVGDWTDPSGRTHQISMTMRLKEWNGGSVSELYRFDGHGNIVGDGRFWINTAYGSGYSSLPAKVEQAMGKVDTSKRVGCSWTVEFTYADTGEKVPDTFKGVTGFNDLDGWDAQSDLKFEGVQLLSGFDGAYKRSDAELASYGTNGFAGIKHDAGDEAYLDAPQQSRHRLAATWTGSTFTFSYDLGNPAGRTDGSRMTFGAPVTRTAVLTYDRNAADAAGSVPSDTTPGTTRTVSSKTDGKVSDLVQRTTTHDDGSVTVRTVDQSTDVVSGCQVYYPAGQRITLATMAKDDDCWDSSMLSRPGHTQLGWNQDRNATQAQAEVTMVEGGMTVFAVWVGNPVLTYDTNKPATWSGQMPSTPASVSVPYNTAATDKSGWAAGDTSKIRGYKFLGWYTAPQDNTGLYQWATPLTGNVTVYAHWQRLQANVVYDKNASDAKGSHANTTGWQYSDVTVPSDTSKSFTRDGYVFKGWSTKPGKADVVYKDGSKVPLQDKDITLYAQWQQVFEQFNPTGGVSLPLLIAGGVTLLVMGIGSTVMLTRRMRGER